MCVRTTDLVRTTCRDSGVTFSPRLSRYPSPLELPPDNARITCVHSPSDVSMSMTTARADWVFKPALANKDRRVRVLSTVA